MQSFSPTRYFRHVTVGSVPIILKEVSLLVKRKTGSYPASLLIAAKL